MDTSDFLVIGGGIIGVCVARELRKRFHGARVALLEKEAVCGFHASGRNSGVLHAGFYYTADSLKAKFTRVGNRRLTEYCKTKNLRLNPCGKLVVARNAAELDSLRELERRGEANGVELRAVSAAEAREIEPRVKTFQRALFSPATATVDPLEVLRSLQADAVAEGVAIRTDCAYLGREGDDIITAAGRLRAKYLVNAAGLYADKIGRDFGFARNHRILPFKGLYLYSDDPPGALRTNIYPVPDLRNPFLGVHFTVAVDGRVKIGPTAIPAFWREQYAGWERFSAAEFAGIVFRQAGLMLSSGFDFKRLAWEEIRKYSGARMARLAGQLAEGVSPGQFSRWGKPGIRAQLLDIRSGKLEMDFVIEGDGRSLHILNAVSPGFTCAFPFAEYVCDAVQRLRQ